MFERYMRHYKYVNNWDLVDLSAPNIPGAYLHEKSYKPLIEFACANNFWKRRIAIVSTLYSIKRNQFKNAIRIATMLKDDSHDLIHKAVGWMLREIGNRDLKTEEKFLLSKGESGEKVYRKMPRTMLRYAIEKFPETKRKKYLLNKI